MAKSKVAQTSKFSGRLLNAEISRASAKNTASIKRTGKRVGVPRGGKPTSYTDVAKLQTSLSLGQLDTLQELQPDINAQLNKIFISKVKDWETKQQNNGESEHKKVNKPAPIKQDGTPRSEQMSGFKSVKPQNSNLNLTAFKNMERSAQYSQKEQNVPTNTNINQIVEFKDVNPKITNHSHATQHAPSHIEEKSLMMLSSVPEVLKDLFLLKFTSHADRYLNYAEIAVLATVLEKKFNTALPIKNVYSLADFKYLASVQSTKRPEESYKFVFKYAFKHLKERFCERNGLDISTIKKPEVFVQFYKSYFGSVSEKCNVSIESFYLPLTPDTYGLDLSIVAAKTINSTYVRLIIKSKQFLADFMEFINEKFKNEYISIVPKKIDNMVDKLEDAFETAWYNDRYIDVICDNIRSNKRCKLPWTIKELDYAIRQTNKLISKNLSKNNK